MSSNPNELEMQRQINRLERKLDELATRDRAPFIRKGSPVFIADAMVADYIGPQSYATDYTGSADGNFGQQATIPEGTLLGGVIFRKGLFGKAVQVAEPSTNLIFNPSFEAETGTTITAWTRNTFGTITGYTGAVEATPFATLGYNAWHCKQPNILGAIWIDTVIGPLTGAHVASVNIEVLSGRAFLRIWNGTADIASLEITTSGRHYLPFTAAGTTIRVIITVGSVGAIGVGEIYADCVQVEAKAYPTPYLDGSLGDGHSWAGTANNSASSRKEARLSYFPTVVGRGSLQGSAMAWINAIPHLPYSIVFETRGPGITAGWRLRLVPSGGQFFLQWVDPADVTQISAEVPAVVSLDEWHHVAVTWDFIAGSFRIFWDGAELGQYTGPITWHAPAQFLIGTHHTGTGNSINGLVANLVLTSRVIEPAVFANIFKSLAPAYTTDVYAPDLWRNEYLNAGAKMVLFPENSTFAGEILITNLNNRSTALFLVSRFTCILIAETTASNWSNTIGTASRLNVGWDTGGVSLQNNLVSNTPFAIHTRRMPIARQAAHP